MERYHIEVPPPLPGTSSRQALRAENVMLRDIIRQAGIALEEDYAQMKLMDLENERLRKQVFERENRSKQSKLTSAQARHMTAIEMLDFLARQDWESQMKDVFKELAPQFKILKKNITDYQKAIEKAKKIEENNKKKAAAANARAERARNRGRGTRGRRGRGGGQGARGRGAAGRVNADMNDPDSSGTTDSSGSSSDSESEADIEIPIPRSRRQRPIQVIQGHSMEVPTGEKDQEVTDEDTRYRHTDEHSQLRPPPRPCMRMHRPPDTQDVEAAGEPEE